MLIFDHVLESGYVKMLVVEHPSEMEWSLEPTGSDHCLVFEVLVGPELEGVEAMGGVEELSWTILVLIFPDVSWLHRLPLIPVHPPAHIANQEILLSNVRECDDMLSMMARESSF
jgi:hypothetical protein